MNHDVDRIISASRAVAKAAAGDVHEDFYRLHPCCNGPDFEKEHYSNLLDELVAAFGGEP